MDERELRGVTLLELLIVLSLFSMLMGLGLFVSFSDYRGTRFNDERALIVGALQKARSQALGNRCGAVECMAGEAHGVYVSNEGSYVIYEGMSYATRRGTQDEMLRASDAGVRVSGCRDLVFQAGSGNASCVEGEPDVVVEQAERSERITVSPVGQIWWDTQ